MQSISKLNPFKAVTYSLHSLYQNKWLCMRLSAPWLLVSYAMIFILAAQRSAPPSPKSMLPLLIALSVILLLAVPSMAVSWHRHILLSEPQTGNFLPRLDRRVWRYFLNTFALAIVFAFAIMPAKAIGFGLLTLAVSLCLSAMLARAALKFPAMAVEDDADTDFGDSFFTTQGQTWRLIGAWVLIGGLSVVVERIGLAAILPVAGATGLPLQITAYAMLLPVWLFTSLAGVSLLTTCYRHFILREEIGWSAPAAPSNRVQPGVRAQPLMAGE